MIIQDPKTKEFKEYEPHELPDGCVISYKSDVGRTVVNRECLILDREFKDVFFSMCIEKYGISDIKLHDIVNAEGESTHYKLYKYLVSSTYIKDVCNNNYEEIRSDKIDHPDYTFVGEVWECIE